MNHSKDIRVVDEKELTPAQAKQLDSVWQLAIYDRFLGNGNARDVPRGLKTMVVLDLENLYWDN